MHQIKQQQGMATILIVLLIGMTVMLLSATVAKSLLTKKEAGVAAHAQTNAELMGWAGVSAFREYLLAQGNLGASYLVALHGVNEIDLKQDATLKKEIFARNIQVKGCTTEGGQCIVSADVSASNNTSQAATTIRAVYSIVLKEGITTVIDKELKASFGGDLLFAGGTITAEDPNANIVLNVKGDVTLNTNFKLQNVKQLTINAEGNVDINCVAMNCAAFENVNINAKGWVNIHEGLIGKPANFGNINAEGKVTLQTYVNAKNIQSMSDVYIALESSADNITALGNVTLFDRAEAQNIQSNGNVKLTNSTARDIQANGNVTLTTTAQANHVQALGYVYLELDSIVNGNVKAKGNNEYLGYSVYVLSGAEVKGTIYARNDVRILVSAKVRDLYVTGKVEGLGGTGTKHNNQNISTLPSLDFPSVNGTEIYNAINENMDFGTLVDVTQYKHEANYIFVSQHGFGRVILNKLKHPSTGATYIYDNGIQKVIEDGETMAKTVGDGLGFFIGDYDLQDSSSWLPTTGAICQTLSNRSCSSNIIGYLPRINVKRVGVVSEDYNYATGIWYLRSTSGNSALDNAAFAPGILYFDNAVNITGIGNGAADSTNSAFTNTILAEGSIDAMALSPRLYSPYAVIREGQPALICNRSLKRVSNAAFTATNPTTLSSKYLIPTNLCKNDNEFLYTMDRNLNTGEKLQVTIDNTQVDKLDLGYVALMSNEVIRVGTCARIYGDVYARDTVEMSASCGVTSSSQAIVGNIATQGKDKRIGNTFGINTNYTIPNSTHTNVKGATTTTTSQGLKAETSAIQWAKYN